ncbi:hypothetical protein L3X38_016360 [Prunus dulcis]|uniref:Uncharacterized protein n=1 Tax=Prunus dulcis TaxID=3755 RepID=A0AAD4W5T2_PRUDU|nr:hypothetical protein L3X38_016360 [Prunus dulcis]
MSTFLYTSSLKEHETYVPVPISISTRSVAPSQANNKIVAYEFVGHPTTACQTLRKILHAEIHDGTLKLPSRKQAFDEDPLPERRGNEMAAIISCFDDLLDDNVLCHPWKNDPKPSEAIWEPCGNMEKACLHKYSKSSSYNTPWPLADGCEDGSSSEVFTLDMLEERHLGASFGQQTVAMIPHNLTKVEENVMDYESQITF